MEVGKTVEELANKQREHFVGREDMNKVCHYTQYVLKYSSSEASSLTQAMFSMNYYKGLISKYSWAKREYEYHKQIISNIKK